MKTIQYPAHGWLAPGAHLEIERDDQGKDLVTNWRGIWRAPGSGVCELIGSDRPFPNGFGPRYPVVRIDTGPFAGHSWYLGHTTSLVSPGQTFTFGHPIAVSDQGHDFEGSHGGWCELGIWVLGRGPLPNSPSHWYDHLLETPLVVPVPFRSMRYGDKGMSILGMSSRLRDCGYLRRPYWHFDSHVHGAVIAFKVNHKIPMPPKARNPRKQQDRGVVDEATNTSLKLHSDWCKKHHKHEFP